MENFEKFIVELLENKIREVRRIRKAEEKALTEGRTEGRREGRTEGILQVAKNMLKKNMERKQIEELTGLTRRRNRKIGKK